MSDLPQYSDESLFSADPDRFAAALARLQGARDAAGPWPDQRNARAALPSRRARRPLVDVAQDGSAPPASTPSAALEVARLYSATAGHPIDVAPEPGGSPERKPRFSLARSTALVAVCAVLTVGGGVVVGSLWHDVGLEPSAASGLVASAPAATAAAITSLPDEDEDPPALAAPPEVPTPEVYVHVVGQVAKPGVVLLPAGSRAADAIAAAGGATSGADLAAINLARIVVDGEQLRVPAPGEEIAPPPAAPPDTSGPRPPEAVPAGTATGASAPADGAPTAADPSGKINLNTADSTMLQTLPGIGPALSQRIIDWRTANGPFASVEEITNVSGIGPAILSNVRDKVVV